MMGFQEILRQKQDETQLTQYLAAFAATITLFISGIYQGWGGPSIVKLLSDEYPIKVSEDEASYIAVVGAIGHVIAGFLASFLSDRIGRKYTIIGICIPQVLSFTMIFLSYHSKILLYIARIFGGMGEGGSLALIPCYIAEIAESNVRGTLGAFITVTIMSGILFINVIGSFLTIHQAALVCLIFPILFWITFISMPESPYYCLMKNDAEGARISLQMLRRKQNVDNEMIQLTLDVKRQMSERGTFRDLFVIASNRKAFLIVAVMRCLQLFSGTTAITAYSQIIIAQATNFAPVLGSCIILIGNLIMVLISSCYIDRIGRKPMFVMSAILTFLMLYSQAIFLTLKDYTSIDVSSVSWISVLIIFLFNVSFCSGLGPGVNVFIGEIFSASIKSKAMAACSLIFAGSFISTIKIYQFTADHIGMAVPFYIFGSVTAFGVLFFAFVIPETKGKSLETIQQELKGNVKTDIL